MNQQGEYIAIMKKIRCIDAVAIYLMALTLQMITALILPSLMPTEGDAFVFISYILPQATYIIVLAVYMFTLQIPFGVVIVTKPRVKPLAIVAVVAITIGVFMQNLFFAQAFSWLMEAIGVEMSVTMPSLNTAGNIITAIAIMCILPALGEESMFRGAMLQSIKEESGNLSAIVLSGAIFAFSHMNTAQLLHQFILGMLLAYVVIRSGNIIYAMIIHFLNNLFAIVLPLSIPQFNNLAGCTWANAGILIAMSVAGMCVLYPALRWFISITSGQHSWSESKLIPYIKTSWSEFDKSRQCHIALYILTLALGAVCLLITIMSLYQ